MGASSVMNIFKIVFSHNLPPIYPIQLNYISKTLYMNIIHYTITICKILFKRVVLKYKILKNNYYYLS